MSLDRSNLTHSSRVMVPAYPCLMLLMGTAYTAGGLARTASSSFDAARYVMPITGYGYIFLLIAAFELLGLLFKRELVYVIGLAMGMGMSFAWSGFFLVSVFTAKDSSLTIPGIWFFIFLAHTATFVSLTRDSGDSLREKDVRDVTRRDRATD